MAHFAANGFAGSSPGQVSPECFSAYPVRTGETADVPIEDQVVVRGRDSAPALIRRLLFEQAAGQSKRYALAFALMGVAALATGLGAYLIGDVINRPTSTRTCRGSSRSASSPP